MSWIKVTDRMPPEGKLVYTKDENGYVTAHTLYDTGWNTKLSDRQASDNSAIEEWREED